MSKSNTVSPLLLIEATVGSKRGEEENGIDFKRQSFMSDGKTIKIQLLNMPACNHILNFLLFVKHKKIFLDKKYVLGNYSSKNT